MRYLLMFLFVGNIIFAMFNGARVIIEPPNYFPAVVACLNISAAIILGITLKGLRHERS